MEDEYKVENKYPTIEEITDLCLQKYETLAKTGKPNYNEWTVMAGIVITDATSTGARVVALSTGTKCLGADKMCAMGLKLNDSHAEVLARRAFMRFCYEQLFVLNQKLAECESIFTWNELKTCYELNPHISFHFFSTRLPCGDACIPHSSDDKEEEEKDNIDVLEPRKKKIKYDKDLIYTGAKIIDMREGTDKMAQNPCAMRLKPGKGIRTSSMSCSDKLARWNIMGIQGALLYAITLQPIYFSTINVLSANAEKSVLERAIYKRFKNHIKKNSLDLGNFIMQKPQIRVLKPSEGRFFKASDSIDTKKPSPLGLVWCEMRAIKNQSYQVCVEGKRQGVSAKRQENPQSALNISKYHILQSFLCVILNKLQIHERLDLQPKNGFYCYKKCKQSAKTYEQSWQSVKKNIFGTWTNKFKDYEKFSITDPRSSEHNKKNKVENLNNN